MMRLFSPSLIPPLFSILLLPTLFTTPIHAITYYTSVQMTSTQDNLHAYCRGLPPRRCCLPPASLANAAGEFSSLPPYAVAVFWGKTSVRNFAPEVPRGCETLDIMATHTGNPQWRYWAPPNSRVGGGSYFHCPKPGVRDWVGTAVAGLGEAVGSGLIGFLRWCSETEVTRRGDSSGDGPAGWVYPDVITVNGTNYTDEWRGDMVYRDKNGNMLDLKVLEG